MRDGVSSNISSRGFAATKGTRIRLVLVLVIVLVLAGSRERERERGKRTIEKRKATDACALVGPELARGLAECATTTRPRASSGPTKTV